MVVSNSDNLTVFFTEGQAAKLARLSVSTLRDWQRRELISVTGRPENAGGPYSRFYTFTDVLTLRLLSKLRKEFGVSLRTIEQTSKELASLGEDPWRRTIYVLNRQVLFEHPTVGDLATSAKQLALIDLRELERETRGEVEALVARPAGSDGQITRHRNVLGNSFTLEGTRVRTTSILAFHEAGYSNSQIQQECPGLSEADIQAAIAFERSRSSTAA